MNTPAHTIPTPVLLRRLGEAIQAQTKLRHYINTLTDRLLARPGMATPVQAPLPPDGPEPDWVTTARVNQLALAHAIGPDRHIRHGEHP